MAITHVGSTKGNGKDILTAQVPKPGGIAVDDLLVVTIASNRGSGVTVTPPAGWTLVARVDDNNAAGNEVGFMYYKVATSTEVAASTFDFTFDQSSNNQAAFGCTAFRGVDTATPEDASVVTTNPTTSSGSPDPDAITTVTDGAVVLAFIAQELDTTYTIPSGYFESWQDNSTGDTTAEHTSGAAAYKVVDSAGSEDPGAFVAAAGSDAYVTITWAIRPDAEAATALGRNALTGDSSAVNATSYATASITPTAGGLVLAAFDSSTAAPSPVEPTASGCGLTWEVVRTFVWDDTGTSRRLTLFKGTGDTPTAGAVTFDLGADTQLSARWSIVEYINADTTIVQDVQDPSSVSAGTSVAPVLAAFADSSNVTYGVAAKEVASDGDMAGDGNMNEIHNVADSEDNARIIVQDLVGEENTVNWSWGTSRRSVGFAVEIGVAAAGGGGGDVKFYGTYPYDILDDERRREYKLAGIPMGPI